MPSYIPVRLGDLVRHKRVDFGLGIVMEQKRTYVVVKWFGLANKTSQSPHDLYPVIERENNEV